MLFELDPEPAFGIGELLFNLTPAKQLFVKLLAKILLLFDAFSESMPQ